MPRAVIVERSRSRLYRSLGSIRFRLALIYSVLLFGLGAIAVGGIYWGLARNLDTSPLSHSLRLEGLEVGGELAPGEEQALRELLGDVETQANERAMEQLANYSLFALAILFGGSMVVGWFLAGHVLKPVGRITEVARRISATDLSQRIALSGPPDELRRLADTFDDMLDRLDRSFDAQRGFVEDASHELRNPLAVIRSNLDTTLADPDATVEDYRFVAEQVSRSVERMSRVVDDLVTFARHETRPQHLTLVDIGELSRQATAEFEGYAANQNVMLTHYAPSGLLALGDAGSLRQALANLLSNALSVAPARSEVRITAGGEGAWIRKRRPMPSSPPGTLPGRIQSCATGLPSTSLWPWRRGSPQTCPRRRRSRRCARARPGSTMPCAWRPRTTTMRGSTWNWSRNGFWRSPTKSTRAIASKRASTA